MDHFAQLRMAWERFGDDDDAWVAVITGVGPDFCVGADLKTYIPQITTPAGADEGAGVTEIDGYRLDDGVKAVLRNVKLYKPIVAAINGTCVAGGMEMLGGCDIRVAADTATFGVHGTQAGAVRRRWHHRAPPPPDPLPGGHGAPALRRPGLGPPGPRDGPAQRGVRPGPVMERALDYARRITANGPLAVRKTKESVLTGLAVDMKEAYRIESAISAEVFSSEDAVEGPEGLRREAHAGMEEPLSAADTGETSSHDRDHLRSHADTFVGARVLITGGSSGIGAGLAEAFAAAGATVGIAARAPRPAGRGARALPGPQPRLHHVGGRPVRRRRRRPIGPAGRGRVGRGGHPGQQRRHPQAPARDRPRPGHRRGGHGHQLPLAGAADPGPAPPHGRAGIGHASCRWRRWPPP